MRIHLAGSTPREIGTHHHSHSVSLRRSRRSRHPVLRAVARGRLLEQSNLQSSEPTLLSSGVGGFQGSGRFEVDGGAVGGDSVIAKW